MTKLEKLAAALKGSSDATCRVRCMKALALEYPPSGTTGRFPFPGHRTVATIDAQRAAARKREREIAGHRNAMKYGFDPASLKASGR